MHHIWHFHKCWWCETIVISKQHQLQKSNFLEDDPWILLAYTKDQFFAIPSSTSSFDSGTMSWFVMALAPEHWQTHSVPGCSNTFSFETSPPVHRVVQMKTMFSSSGVQAVYIVPSPSAIHRTTTYLMATLGGLSLTSALSLLHLVKE